MRRGDLVTFLRVFHDRLNSPDAQLELAQAMELASEHSIEAISSRSSNLLPKHFPYLPNPGDHHTTSHYDAR